jgi:flavin-dependent dehydrogenase
LLRRRVLALPGICLRDGTSVTGIQQDADGWAITLAASSGPSRDDQGVGSAERVVEEAPSEMLRADLVVDASGRNSRLMQWLGGSWRQRVRVSEVDARIGYASRLYRGIPDVGGIPGIVILATPADPVGALALPVENGQWMVLAVGLGERRPTRDADEFDAFLAGLRDPAVWQLAQQLEPVGDVVVHRQTGNRRRHYEDLPDWPQGLVVVGDAFCAFNPVYGQGIAVAACEAVLLRNSLRANDRPGRGQVPAAAVDTRRLQRQFAEVTELPWSIATGQDLRFPTSEKSPTWLDALSNGWGMELGRLAGHGNERAAGILSGVYHLMLPAHRLFHPALVIGALRSRLFGLGPAVQRPAGLPPLPTGMK